MEYGHFRKDGEAFVITQRDIPRHWYNYFWNDTYLSFSSQVGFGEGFAQDNLGRRIRLVANRNLYVADGETGQWWTATGLPVQQPLDFYECTHGIGYSEIKLERNGIHTSYRLFVPKEGNFEIWTVRVKNNRRAACSLKLFPYVRTELDGGYKPQGYNTATGFSISQGVAGQTFSAFGSGETEPVYGYLISSRPVSGFDTRKNAFIGPYNDESAPSALLKGGCQNSGCNSEKLCFALETAIHLTPGEETACHFIVGATKDRTEIDAAASRYFEPGAVEQAFVEVLAQRREQIAGVDIQTPDQRLNLLFHSFLKYETCMGSRWARVRHNGYRDMTSDCECFGAVNPKLAWQRLKRVLSYQYENGYAPRTFLDGQIQDNHFADNTVWLTFAVSSLVNELGNLSLLEELVPFNNGVRASVYEHLKRSVEFLWQFRGLHGLVKIWGGDWNDGMNRVGMKGKGVSVWLSIAWYRANSQFAALAKRMQKRDDADQARKRGEEMKQIINTAGWDGAYYLYAYTDRDEKIGSHENQEGSLYLNPQIWAVLSGVAPPERARSAMAAVDRELDTPLGTLVCAPAYHTYQPNIGAMTAKPAGVHENGGVYLHSCAWKLAADAMLKRAVQVEKGLDRLLPWPDQKSEPYVLSNSYFTEETGYRVGSPGQSWRTASGAWLLKAVVQYLFGLQPQLEGLRLDPCLPPSWDCCSITKHFRGAVYHISYTRSGPGCQVLETKVDGQPISSPFLPLTPGRTYEVEVRIGSSSDS